MKAIRDNHEAIHREKTSRLAWIPTRVSWPNKRGLLSENQTKAFAVKPGDRQIRFAEAGCQEQGVVRSLLKADLYSLIGDRHLSGGADQIAKEVPALGGFIAVADALPQKAIEAAAVNTLAGVSWHLARNTA